MSDQKEAKPAAKSLAEVRKPQQQAVVSMGFGNSESFALMQRAANLLANSTLVPVAYRTMKEVKEYGKVVAYEDNPNAIPNCVVALNMAQRMGADPLMVMQNLYIVEGRPSWSSQFIIAAINSCGRYSPLRFDISPKGAAIEVEYETSEWVNKVKTNVKKTIKLVPRTCVAWAIELATGDRLESPEVSMDMAVAEGWITKNGSKWQTMPEVMLRYRAAAFFGKTYAPELLMGLQTAEEAHDIIDVQQQPNGQYAATLDELRAESKPEAKPEPEAETVAVKEEQAAAQESKSEAQAEQPTATETIDKETGEVYQAAAANPAVVGLAGAMEAAQQVSPARAQINEALAKARGQSAQKQQSAEDADYQRSQEKAAASAQAEAAAPADAAPTSRVRRKPAANAPE